MKFKPRNKEKKGEKQEVKKEKLKKAGKQTFEMKDWFINTSWKDEVPRKESETLTHEDSVEECGDFISRGPPPMKTSSSKRISSNACSSDFDEDVSGSDQSSWGNFEGSEEKL